MLQNGGKRKDMLIPDSGGCEAFLGVLRDILGDLLLEQAGIDQAQRIAQSVHERGLARSYEHLMEDHLP
jgi:hypothetical protein